MSLEIMNKINIDFSDNKYTTINAKQYDKKSRFILVTCYNNGKLFYIDKNNNTAYIRYRKSDNFGVFNDCEITDEGNILVELTEQMLSTPGNCYADLVLLNNNPTDEKNGSVIDENGKLIVSENDSILSTMTFRINVFRTSYDNEEIESSYEYNALNNLMIKATENYEYIINVCEAIRDSIDGSFVIMGTITYEELSSVEKRAGYLYNISNDFITDETFKCGAGVSYPAGTNVYYTSDGYWDCSSVPIIHSISENQVASLSEVKLYLGI